VTAGTQSEVDARSRPVVPEGTLSLGGRRGLCYNATRGGHVPATGWRESAGFAALLTVLVAAGSCGGTPSAPSPLPPPVSPPASPPVFQAGPYYLDVGRGSHTSPGPGGAQFQISLCVCVGTACPTSIRVPVDVEAVGDLFSVRAVFGTLGGSIAVEGVGADVVLRGGAREAQSGPLGIFVQGTEARLTGTLTSDRTVSGTVTTGSIDLLGPAGSGGCSPTEWSLSAR
jgi:hypothetical protein